MEVPNKIHIILHELEGFLKVQDLQIHWQYMEGLQILQHLNPKPGIHWFPFGAKTTRNATWPTLLEQKKQATNANQWFPISEHHLSITIWLALTVTCTNGASAAGTEQYFNDNIIPQIGQLLRKTAAYDANRRIRVRNFTRIASPWSLKAQNPARD